MSNNGRVPLVRPPQWAGGGGSQDPFGPSGAPGLPEPDRGARLERLDRELADDERGRFSERVYRFPDFGSIATGTTSNPSIIQVASNRSNFLRMVALRGGLSNAATIPLTGLELAGLRLRLQINGSEDFTTNGTGTLPAEFDGLFTPTAPWWWFANPPRLRAFDQVQAFVTNNFTAAADNHLTPYLLARFVDDAWWRELYGT